MTTAYTLVPNSTGSVYGGTTTYTTDCFVIQGDTYSVESPNGTTQTESVKLKVANVDRYGYVSQVSGTMTFSETPNATGLAAGCKAGTATATFAGTVTPPPTVTTHLSSTFLGGLAGDNATILGGDDATVTGIGAVTSVAQVCITATWTINGTIGPDSDTGFIWGPEQAIFPFYDNGWNPVGRTYDLDDIQSLNPSALLALIGHKYSETATDRGCGPPGSNVLPAGGVGQRTLILGSFAIPIDSISHSAEVQLYSSSGALLNTVTGPTVTSKGHAFIQDSAGTCTGLAGGQQTCA